MVSRVRGDVPSRLPAWPADGSKGSPGAIRERVLGGIQQSLDRFDAVAVKATSLTVLRSAAKPLPLDGTGRWTG